MGSFEGHLLPGCFFVAFGTWWTSQIVRRSIMCTMQSKPFYCTVTYPCPMHGRCVQWPLEAAVKIMGTLVAMAAELFAAANYGQGGGFVFMGDLQHVTMYAFFCMSGVIDILHSYRKIPDGIDYMMQALAFLAEGVLFSYHLHSQNRLATMLHTLLVFVIFACVLVTALELNFRASVLAGLSRAFFVLLQGTWFIQVGFILHNPVSGVKKLDMYSHESQVVAAMIFAWHLLGVFLLMGAVAALSQFFNQRYCHPTLEDISYELVSSTEEDTTSDEEPGLTIQDSIDDRDVSDDPYSEINTYATHSV